MNETPTPREMTKLIDIRIKIDEFEDSILESLEEIRVAIRSGDIAKSDDLITILIDTLGEDVEEG